MQGASKHTILSNPTAQTRFHELQLQIVPTDEEYKEPIQVDSASIRIDRRPVNDGSRVNIITECIDPGSNKKSQFNGHETLNSIARHGQVTPYSFADGLNLNHDREAVKRSLMSERIHNNTDCHNGMHSSLELHLQNNKNNRAVAGSTGKAHEHHPKYQHNPFQMAESIDEYNAVSKHALNRMTSNFGNNNMHDINL